MSQDSKLEIYTDASISDKENSWAFVINHNIFYCGVYPSLSDSSFHAELRAINEAVKWVNNQMIHNDVIIYCDSNSVVNACKSNTDRRNRIWSNIIKARNEGFQFQWVKRNTCDENALADDLCSWALKASLKS